MDNPAAPPPADDTPCPAPAAGERRRRPAWPVLVLAALVIGWLAWRDTGGAGSAPAKTTHSFGTMRTEAHFIVLSSGGLPVDPAEALRQAEEAVREVERLMNPYAESSDLWRLNHASAGEWVSVHPLTWRVVMEALRFHRLSGGAFDPTVGPLKQLYFPGGQPRGGLPDEAERAEVRAKVGADKLRFEREGMRLSFDVPGMRLDLSALAKGFAVDRAMETLQAHGARDALVEIGGELRMIGTVPAGGISALTVGPGKTGAAARATAGGTKADGGPERRPWKVEVLDPRHPDLPPTERQYLARTEGSVATSGDYEQYFEVGGKRYSHLLDPRTGWPVDKAVAATVVLPGPCIQADALATTLCVLGPDGGRKFMEERADDLFANGLEAWIYTVDGSGRVQRGETVIAGEGLDRMRGGAAPAQERQRAEADKEEAAKEANWIQRVLP